MDTNTMLTRKAVHSPDFDLRAAVKEIREANSGLARVQGEVMWNAALVMGEAKGRDMIGSKDGAVWPTQQDYAAAAGYKPSTGTLLSRLAVAQGHGLPTGTHWSFLVQNGTNARVGAAVKEAANLKDLKSRLAPLMEERTKTGKIASATAAPGEGAQQTAAEKEAAAKAAATPAAPTVKDVLVALHATQAAIHGFTDAQWSEVKEAMLKQVKAEDHRRDLLGKAAAKRAATNGKSPAKATPATVAKVVAKKEEAAA